MSQKIQNIRDKHIRKFVQSIEKQIYNINSLFHINPTLFLTESDVKCNLYSEIIKLKDLNPNNNNPLVFTELAERLERNIRNLVRSDITVFMPNTLNLVLDNRPQYIDKNFSANGSFIDIEIKFIRDGNFTNEVVRNIEVDLNKLNRIRELDDEDNTMIYSFMIIVSRDSIESDLKRHFNEIINNNNKIDIVYMDL